MAKRANGEGSIRKHASGKWVVSMPTGLYKENGKREYIYRYAKTQAEAREIRSQLEKELRSGVNTCKSVKTGDWMEDWIENVKARKLAPSTLTSYRTNFRLHIRPFIGDIVLRNLETHHIQRCLDKIGGSYSTFVKNYNIIHGAMEYAVKQGKIVRNPCIGVAFPTDDTEEMRVLKQEEQQRFIAALDGEYYRPMLLMYLYTGLRIGEGIPLTWADIDLDERTIRVCKKAIVCHDFDSHSAPQVVQDFCKTKSSKRRVVITAGLVSILREHKENAMKQVEQAGEQWSDDRLVFPNTRGNMVHSRNLQHVLERIFAKCGIEGATMHTLRHTYATRCFEADVNIKALSKQLGHKKVKTTYDIYVHVLEDTQAKEIDKLAEIDKLLG